MTWFYLAIGSALSFTSLNLLSRVVSLNSKNPRAMSFVFNFIALLMSLVVFFCQRGLQKIFLPTDFTPWFYLSIAIFFYGMFERLRFRISKDLEASHLTIINNISLAVAVIMSFYLYSEALTVSKALGFLLILTALLLVSINKIKKTNWSGVLLAVLANVFLGIGWALDKKGVYFFNAETYNVFVWLFPLFILYFPYIKLSDLKKEIKISSWKIALLSSINVVGYYLMLKAFALVDATKVIPVGQTSTIMTVIAGIFLLKERKHILRKIIAGAIAVLGVYLLV